MSHGVHFTKPKPRVGHLTGYSPFWEAQDGGIPSLKLPRILKYKIFARSQGITRARVPEHAELVPGLYMDNTTCCVYGVAYMRH